MLVTIRPSGKSQGNVCSSTLPTKLQSSGACILSPSLRRRGLGGGERLRKPARKSIPLLCLLLAGFVCPASAASADTITKQVAPGIVYTQEITTGASPLIVNILRIELSAPGVHVRCGQALDAITLRAPTLGRETIPSLARRSHAIAGVNADFFPFTGDPLGLAVRDSELLSEPANTVPVSASGSPACAWTCSSRSARSQPQTSPNPHCSASTGFHTRTIRSF